MPRGRPTSRHEGDLCDDCGTEPVRFKGYTDSGNPRFDKYCGPCHKGRYMSPWLKFRGSECEMCGYQPFTGKWALEVHHIDEDKTNNEPENLMTVCSNCHREIHGLLHEYQDSDVALSVLEKLLKRLMG